MDYSKVMGTSNPLLELRIDVEDLTMGYLALYLHAGRYVVIFRDEQVKEKDGKVLDEFFDCVSIHRERARAEEAIYSFLGKMLAP